MLSPFSPHGPHSRHSCVTMHIVYIIPNLHGQDDWGNNFYSMQDTNYCSLNLAMTEQMLSLTYSLRSLGSFVDQFLRLPIDDLYYKKKLTMFDKWIGPPLVITNSQINVTVKHVTDDCEPEGECWINCLKSISYTNLIYAKGELSQVIGIHDGITCKCFPVLGIHPYCNIRCTESDLST